MPTLRELTDIFDRYHAVVWLATVISLLGFGVVTPNARITHLEAQQKKDHVTLLATTEYVRITAVATCLDSTRVSTRLVELMCARVLSDPSVLSLPR